jgi:hypothetical protein
MKTLAANELRNFIIGACTLESYESFALDGLDVRYPLGTNGKGIIMYTADGHLLHKSCAQTAHRFTRVICPAATKTSLPPPEADISLTRAPTRLRRRRDRPPRRRQPAVRLGRRNTMPRSPNREFAATTYPY